MPKNLTLVVYKPDSQSTDEYMVYVNFAEVGPSFVFGSSGFRCFVLFSIGNGKMEVSAVSLLGD